MCGVMFGPISASHIWRNTRALRAGALRRLSLATCRRHALDRRVTLQHGSASHVEQRHCLQTVEGGPILPRYGQRSSPQRDRRRAKRGWRGRVNEQASRTRHKSARAARGCHAARPRERGRTLCICPSPLIPNYFNPLATRVARMSRSRPRQPLCRKCPPKWAIGHGNDRPAR